MTTTRIPWRLLGTLFVAIVSCASDPESEGSGAPDAGWADAGGGYHISGALAVADVLGIFGREGVALALALANYWPFSTGESFAHAAFRAFRNYDGRGGTVSS